MSFRRPVSGVRLQPASLCPVRGGLDLPALLPDSGGTAIGHGHTHREHRCLHTAAAAAHLGRVHAGRNGGDELGARVDDVWALKERLFDAHVPVIRQATRAGETDGARRCHERDVGDAGQYHSTHDPVVGVHAHGGGRDHRLSEQTAFGHSADTADERVVDLTPLERLLTILAPSKLLRLHHAALPGPLQWALFGLDARQALLGFILPLLPVRLPLL
mmetsp:Transcript_3952/g.12350  ORF Transcript_3952/g.12350 Transcript_3952/m.12350 type:complete len:217 (-) Transcript_3952:282-932(-)